MSARSAGGKTEERLSQRTAARSSTAAASRAWCNHGVGVWFKAKHCAGGRVSYAAQPRARSGSYTFIQRDSS
jgi:hypothetical protein